MFLRGVFCCRLRLASVWMWFVGAEAWEAWIPQRRSFIFFRPVTCLFFGKEVDGLSVQTMIILLYSKYIVQRVSCHAEGLSYCNFFA